MNEGKERKMRRKKKEHPFVHCLNMDLVGGRFFIKYQHLARRQRCKSPYDLYFIIINVDAYGNGDFPS